MTNILPYRPDPVKTQVQRGALDLAQVQVDELRLKTHGLVLWVVCSPSRDQPLAQPIMTWVSSWAHKLPPAGEAPPYADLNR